MSSSAIPSNLSYLWMTTQTSPGVTSSHFIKVGESRVIGLTVDGKEIDVTSHDSLRWEEKLMGNKTWSISVQGLFVDSDAAQKLLEYCMFNAASATFKNVPAAGASKKVYLGKGYPKGFKLDEPESDAVGSSFDIIGTGALTNTFSAA